MEETDLGFCNEKIKDFLPKMPYSSGLFCDSSPSHDGPTKRFFSVVGLQLEYAFVGEKCLIIDNRGRRDKANKKWVCTFKLVWVVPFSLNYTSVLPLNFLSQWFSV